MDEFIAGVEGAVENYMTVGRRTEEEACEEIARPLYRDQEDSIHLHSYVNSVPEWRQRATLVGKVIDAPSSPGRNSIVVAKPTFAQVATVATQQAEHASSSHDPESDISDLNRAQLRAEFLQLYSTCNWPHGPLEIMNVINEIGDPTVVENIDWGFSSRYQCWCPMYCVILSAPDSFVHTQGPGGSFTKALQELMNGYIFMRVERDKKYGVMVIWPELSTRGAKQLEDYINNQLRIRGCDGRSEAGRAVVSKLNAEKQQVLRDVHSFFAYWNDPKQLVRHPRTGEQCHRIPAQLYLRWKSQTTNNGKTQLMIDQWAKRNGNWIQNDARNTWDHCSLHEFRCQDSVQYDMNAEWQLGQSAKDALRARRQQAPTLQLPPPVAEQSHSQSLVTVQSDGHRPVVATAAPAQSPVHVSHHSSPVVEQRSAVNQQPQRTASYYKQPLYEHELFKDLPKFQGGPMDDEDNEYHVAAETPAADVLRMQLRYQFEMDTAFRKEVRELKEQLASVWAALNAANQYGVNSLGFDANIHFAPESVVRDYWEERGKAVKDRRQDWHLAGRDMTTKAKQFFPGGV
ncbi:hypothetical protein HYFRA_00011004 [Hymenoscyphus fraxineus]|uniref:Uncharacterized protein n=1 Tax=Hymenoscyphus fraxineus TaxID=746836 RepID=A0A9N9L042_9HELO|nr:hypothetical protein HYFRA_00011004 [Hymenoscyphus fraxineus]